MVPLSVKGAQVLSQVILHNGNCKSRALIRIAVTTGELGDPGKSVGWRENYPPFICHAHGIACQ